MPGLFCSTRCSHCFRYGDSGKVLFPDDGTMTPFRAGLKEVWNRLTWPDLVSTAVAAGGLLAALFGLQGGPFNFLKYLAVVASVYLLFRLIGWWRDRLLWSLRNRLIVAYLFLAFVPFFSI